MRDPHPPSSGAAEEAPLPETSAPVTIGQRGLWFLDHLAPGGTAYHLAAAFEVHGEAATPEAIRRAFARLHARHEALRMVFPSRDGEPVAVVTDAPLAWREHDLSGLSEPAILAAIEDAVYLPFDLERGPLFRVDFFAGPAGRRFLAVSLHHMVGDFSSLGLMLADLGDALSGEKPTPEGAAPAFSAFATFQNGRLAGEWGEKLWAYWKKELAGLPDALDLPVDRARPSSPLDRAGVRRAELPAATAAGLDRFAAQGNTPFTVLLAAFQAVLARHTGARDLAVGATLAGRPSRWPGAWETIGYFVNPLPLRADLSGDPTFSDLLARARSRAFGALRHQEMPLPFLMERRRRERGEEQGPFRVLLVVHREVPNWEDLPSVALGEAGGRLRVGASHWDTLPLPPRSTQFDLVFHAGHRRGGWGLALQYDAELFDATTAERLLQHFLLLLGGAVAAPLLPLAELPLLTAGERHQLAYEWNDTARGDRERGAPLPEVFAAQVAAAPSRHAVAFGAERLTYAELAERVNRLARHLIALGVRAETPVGIFLRRSPELLFGLLAVMKAGGSYIPLDVSYPEDRLAFMLEDAGVRFVLTQASLTAKLAHLSARLPEPPRAVLLDPAAEVAGAESTADPAVPILLGQAAYTIYTSGSTGRPKGVTVTHASLANMLGAVREHPGFAAADRLIAVTPISFDISTCEMFLPLTVGAEVTIVNRETATDGGKLGHTLLDKGITLLQVTPATWRMLLAAEFPGDPPRLRTISGGEAMSPGLARELLARCREVWNMYGPTEATVWSTAWRVSADPDREGGEVPSPVPIGLPIGGTFAHVLDADLNPVPVGVAGELLVGGRSLARGYLDRPELTAERFIPDPFSGRTSPPGSRLYRTGDLTRRDGRGDVVFLGRLDHQVKVRGYRIELGEVEAVLARHPAVRHEVVVARDDGFGEQMLAAYVVPVNPVAHPTAHELRDFLAETLPDHMVPAAFVFLPELPLTPSGKVDRKALPAPEAAAPQAGGEEPVGPVEELLAALWSDLLHVPRIGRRDNFFELGGHSLLAARALARVREALGVELSLAALFEEPTIAGFARRVEAGRRAAVPTIVCAPRLPGEVFPLSFAQERLWFLDRLEKTAAYNMPMALDLAGPLDLPALAGALAAILERHEALRSAFVTAGDEGVVQRILSADRLEGEARGILPLADLSALPTERAAGESERLSRDLAARPFDLAAGRFSRTVLLRRAAADHRLSWTLHHAAGDAWSLGVLLEDLAGFYAAALEPGSPVPPAPTLQVADFALFERRHGASRDLLPLWHSHLEGVPPLDLPADRPRPARRSLRGATLARRLPGLGPELAAAGRALKVTPFMVLLSAYGALVARSTGETDFAVGTAAARRDHPDLARTVGPFLNTLALRLDLSGEPTFAELAARVRQEALFAYLHQDLPFERLVEALAAARDLSRPPLVSTMMVLQTAPLAVPELPGLAVEVAGIDTGAAQLDLSLSLLPRGGDLEASLQYTRDLFDEPTVVRLLDRFERLLSAALADLGKPVAALAWLSAAERHQLAVEWPATGASPAVSGTALDAFDAAAARHPEAPAVTDGRTAWTYDELAAAAAGVAGRLAAAGITPGKVVALAAGREAAWVAGMLGIWKAGAVYLPLDPALPDARLTYLLSDSGASLALCSDEMGERMAHVAPQLPLAALSAPAENGGEAAAAPVPPAGPRLSDLAYLLYTSGTTGRPKAVAVEHGQLAHLLAATGEAFGDVFARMPALATFAFDISLFELLSPLTTGGTAVLVPLAPTLDVAAFTARLPEFSAFHAVPAALRQIAEAARALAPLPGVRAVFTGGDAVPQDLLAELSSLFPRAAVHVLYGPTETTVLATSLRWGSAPPSRTGAPLGRPLPGIEARVLDPAGEPVPIGVPGEIWIGGGGVARGYWKRPDLSAERYGTRTPPSSLAGQEGARRFYRSGDRARLLADGRLEFLGRVDDQVKVRGFRIEPGEIEAILARQPGVREAVVLAVGEGEARRLVAYCTAPPAPPEIDAWKAALRQVLPEYMVPQAFVVLPELPLAPTGKVDRKALAGLAPETRDARRYEPPADPVEETLAALWGELLGRERVGATDDFFAEGGHSLLATRLASRIRTVFDVELPLSLLFDRPTVRGQAEAIGQAWRDGASGALPPIAPAPPAEQGRPAPLSFAQHRLWFLDRLEPGRATYNLPIAVALSGPLSEEALAAALAAVVARQQSLRTVFPPTAGDPVQVVTAAPFVLPRVDLAGLGGRAAAEAFHLAEEEAARPFDLAAGPLFRPVLFAVGPESRVLSATLHHIVGDGWSMGVFARELEALYAAALAAGDGSPAARARAALGRLPALPIQYTDYARWQGEALPGILARDLAFWQEELAGLPARLELPTDHPRPAVQGLAGARRGVILPPSTVRGLGRLAEENGATLYMVLLAGLAALLSRYSGQDDFAVGTPVAGRNRQELEGLIGFFVNTLVLRCDTAGAPSFTDLVARARQRVLAAQMHQDLPFERLVEELAPERSLAWTPLFQVLFAFQGRGAEIRLPGVAARPLAVSTGTSKFDWVLDLAQDGEGLAGSIEYDRALFDPPTLDRLAGHLGVLLAAAAADPDAPASSLPLLSAAERGQLLTWDDAPGFEAGAEALHAGFERQVERTPDLVAAARHGESWTYRELNRRANRLARHLQALGVGPEVTVGICLPRSLELVAAVYAVLKAGGAYVPLDPAYPAERLAFTAADARARAILTHRGLAGKLGAALSRDREGALSPVPSPATGEGDAVRSGGAVEARWVFVEELGLEGVGFEDDGNPSRVDPGHLAYLIYTSGSTGRPKGVAIEHRSASALIRWSLATYSARELEVVLASTSIGFDMSVFELFAPLALGGRVVVAENALELPELPEAVEVTLVNTVPSAAAELARAGAFPRSVETVNLGGEPLHGALVREVLARSRAGRVINLYGPTEDTTYSTFDVLQRGGETEPTIGRLVSGGRGFVLDREMGLLPVGVPGELFLGGLGVTRGYFDRPALTAERYLPDPFGTAGGRLYRTGDRVRRRPDGVLEYLGRLDSQVKVRGFRVEPGEIEVALLAHPAVREVSVVVRDEEGGGRSLVAWVALAEPGAADAAALAEHLAARLPAHMMPAAFGFLPELPLLPNGKLDRRALAALDPVERGESPTAFGATGRAAVGMLEETVAGVFEQVLGRSGFGRDDSFFDLGGHSLLATQVASRLRELLGVEVPLRALFEAPTVATLAARVEEERGVPTLPPLYARPGERPAPLSFSQARLWLLDQVEPGSAVYNMPLALTLSGPLDRAALAGALVALAGRHEVLRATFQMREDGPVQVVVAAGAPLAAVDLSALPHALAAAEGLQQAGREARRPFDLERGPLLRTLLFVQGPEKHLLSAVMHHSVSDGWSMGIFVRELSALYRAAAERRPSPLPPLAVQYADFALWQRGVLSGERLAVQVDFWRAELAGLPPALELPLDHPRPPVRTWRGRQRPVTLPAGTAAALRRLGRQEGATLFMVLLAAFEALLYRHSHQEDFAVGTPIAGRRHEALEGLIGFFVNTLVLRADLTGNPTFREIVTRARVRSLAAQAHQDLPFEKLVEELNPERNLSQTPLFQTMLVLQNLPRPELALPGLAGEPVDLSTGAAKFDLLLAFEERGEELSGSLEWNPDLFDDATVARLVDRWITLVAGVVTDPALPLADLPLLPATEAQQLFGELAGEGREFERSHAIHGQVEEQAAVRPDAVAVSFEGEQLTYGELNASANLLAHRLRAAGCGLEVPAAVFLPRGLALATALLAALKAGGPYVPIDADAPVDRLGYVLADSGARAVLSHSSLAERLADLPPGVEVIWLDDSGRPADDAETVVAGNPESGAGGNSGAYVIYTSGSTGRPKGVVVTHSEVLRLFAATGSRFAFGPADTWVLFFSYAFDFSVWEIWGALMHGGRLAVVPYLTSRAPDALLEALSREAATVLNQTSSAFRQMIPLALEEGAPELSLRTVIFGGEALDVPSLGPWFARFGDERTRMINMYGITETTVHTTYRWIRQADVAVAEASGRSPIGGALPDLTLYLLGPRGEAVPLGVPGEIAVGGDGLARGYLGRPELTATRFVPDPYAPRLGRAGGARLYRSGDLARYLPNGDMEYLGRIDFQVKVRGFRVELGEIEAVLAAHPQVAKCAVLAREDRPGDRRLVGYAVPADPADPPAPEALRAALQERLPDYMVPAALVLLPELPLTVNGKLDRRALPAPDFTVRKGKTAPPRNQTEATLAAVWKEVLGVPEVGVEDNFFDLGGHSLLLVQAHRKLKADFPSLAVVDLFRYPTIAALAGFLTAEKTEQLSLAESQARGQDRGNRAQRQRELRRQVGLGRKVR